MRRIGVSIHYQIIILLFTAFISHSTLNAERGDKNKVNLFSKNSANEIEHSWSDNDSTMFYKKEPIDFKNRNQSNRPDKLGFAGEKSRKKNHIKPNIKPYQKTKYKKKRNKRAKKFRYYKVRKGDTLYRISNKFKIPVASICKINGLRNKNKIKKGMLLKIPPGNRKKSGTAKTAPPGKKPKFRWPLKYVMHYKRDGFMGVKSIGIVITSKPGASVISSASGVVKKIGHMRGFGRYIVVKHQNRYITVYSNLASISVSEGDRVGTGKIIGRIDKINKKMHFQIDYAGKPMNPLQYLPKKTS